MSMIPESLEAIIAEWMSFDYDPQTRESVQWLIDNDQEGLQEAFAQRLAFGTGGMRGIMGVGTNRMNIYTVGSATQGLANYVKKIYGEQLELRMAIAYDSRNNSQQFAEAAADIMSANGFRVYLYEALRPTPQLSFTVRALRCHCGINITASHNPKEYNGYKVYWGDGGQVTSPHDRGIIEEVNAIEHYSQVQHKGDKNRIIRIGGDLDEVYLSALQETGLFPESYELRDQLSIVYTPIHGTGTNLVPLHLKRLGFNNVHVVSKQKNPDGYFPTVTSPNPEEPSAMALALELAQQRQASIVLGTDPDADRLGAYARNSQGELTRLDGDQIAVLIEYFALASRHNAGCLPAHPYIVRTIVTTPLMDAVAESFGAKCYAVLTGFKYIARLIAHMPESNRFVMGAEESHGYLVGDQVRDKDAVQAAGLFAEMTAWLQAQGKTPIDLLEDIYRKHGFIQKTQKSIVIPGLEGAKEIATRMSRLRENPPTEIGGERIVATVDCQKASLAEKPSKSSNVVLQEPSNVLQYTTERGSVITVRPSGTEPKIKYYAIVNEPFTTLDEALPLAQRHLNALIEDISSR